MAPDPHKLTPREVVHDPQATLNGWRVWREDGRLNVAAGWVSCQGRRCRQAIAVSDDGFRTTRYFPATHRNQLRYLFTGTGVPSSREQRLFPHRIVSPAPTLGQRRGLVAGGDGATLFPFERVARSDDDGRTWTIFRIPLRNGDQAYESGDAVLPDGRLLVLLDTWSGDRRHHRSNHFHGLWVSGRSDWSSLRPYHPTFRPALLPEPHGGSTLTGFTAEPEAGLLSVTTWDRRLYVSNDGGRVFRRTRAR